MDGMFSLLLSMRVCMSDDEVLFRKASCPSISIALLSRIQYHV